MNRCAQLLVLLAALACNSPRDAQRVTASVASDVPVSSDPAVAEQQTAICGELTGLRGRHAWAGTYRWQGGGGLFELAGTCSLEIAPGTGFVMVGKVEGQDAVWNFGTVREEGAVIRLQFETPNANFGVSVLPEEYRVVHWDSRNYLLPEKQLLRFVNAINGGLEPRSSPEGLFPLRLGDELRPALGEPELPPEFAARILEHPIEAQVIGLDFVSFHKTDKWTHLHNPVSVDVGSTDGAFEGMELVFVEPPDSGWLILTKVGEHSSEGQYGYYGDAQPVPRNGWICSTRRR